MTASTRFYTMTFTLMLIVCPEDVFSQSSSGTIYGTISDQNKAVIAGAAITARNTATGFVRSAISDSDGNYRLADIPTGTYQITFEAAAFAIEVRKGVTLNTSQHAAVDAVLYPPDIREQVPVENENASMLNATTAEVSTRFDSRRLSELPTAPNRNLYKVLSSVPGVVTPVTGQTASALGVTLSVNGGRIRSNDFMLDGQDINDPSLTGTQIPLNNPDAIQEVRIVTNQFLPEYGRNSASVVNVVGKSGTNALHGSAFWFHNNENLNACSNTDKEAGFCNPNATDRSHAKAPERSENQLGFTLGGPVVLPLFGEGVPPLYIGNDKTFFFVDYQRWSDRSTNAQTLIGAPTAAGREQLQLRAGNRPHVQQLLRYVPAATPNPAVLPVTVSLSAGSFSVERGTLTATSNFKFDSDQGSFRVDHQIDKNNLIYGRYRYSYEHTTGTGQIVPAGLGSRDDRNAHAASVVWSSAASSISNELRVAWKRLAFVRDGENPEAKNIPSIQITQLGLTGANESETRTAFGLGTNLPVIRANDTYQVTEAISIFKGKHSYKFGVDLRRWDDKTYVGIVGRGNIVYSTLTDFVNDIAQSGSKLVPIRGGETTNFYRWNEIYFYGQDQWKVTRDLTLTYGIRYEYPGDTFAFLRGVNERILAANNYEPAYVFEKIPDADLNNWMPRFGLNWNPNTSRKGLLGFITGGDKLVIRGGYARAYDAPYVNINQNVFLGFPFNASRNLTGNNAFQTAINFTVANGVTSPATTSRGAIADDFRAPATDQFSLGIQRELATDLVLSVGYIRTRGTGLLQSVDGNPRRPCPFGTGPGTCNTTRIDRNTGVELGQPPPPVLVDPTRGNINMRANAASSTYDALQTSLEKRFSRGVSFGLHYTWSSFIDDASDAGAPSAADFSTAQDPYDRKGSRGRSSYDRPHVLNGNIVYELPFFRKQSGLAGVLLGGWQVNSFFNFASGAPMTPLNGTDPAGANVTSPGAVRPNVFTNLDVSNMSIAELYLIDQRLRAEAIARAEQIYNGLTFWPGPCISSTWLPGPPLPFTLFTAPRGRIVCSAHQRSLEVVFNGVPEGQRVGNAGRNILRSDSYKNVDIGFIKNTRITENLRAQLWVDFFNAFNWRSFGIPAAQVDDPRFLNQWVTDGGNRRIRFGARLVF